VRWERSEPEEDRPSELLLLGFCKGFDKMVEACDILGGQIQDYEHRRGQESFRSQEGYFWQQPARQLESPAKMRDALEFSLLSFTGAVEPKD
jgi:hypothetical protein